MKSTIGIRFFKSVVMEWTKLFYNQIQSHWIIILKESYDQLIGLFLMLTSVQKSQFSKHVASHTLTKSHLDVLYFLVDNYIIYAYTKNCSQPNSLNDHSTHCPTQQAFQLLRKLKFPYSLSLFISLSLKQPCIPNQSKVKYLSSYYFDSQSAIFVCSSRTQITELLFWESQICNFVSQVLFFFFFRFPKGSLR